MDPGTDGGRKPLSYRSRSPFSQGFQGEIGATLQENVPSVWTYISLSFQHCQIYWNGGASQHLLQTLHQVLHYLSIDPKERNGAYAGTY
jgi:hypothetical protein